MVRHTALRSPAAGRSRPKAGSALKEAWALLVDDRRAIRIKLALLIVTAAAAAVLEAPWK